MGVASGLPNAVPGTSSEDLIGWARAAEEAGFSSLGTIDRIACLFPSSDPATVDLLAEAAGL